MSARRAARAAAILGLTSGLAAVPGAPVHADDDNVRLVYAVFTGTGSVTRVDGSPRIGVAVDAGTSQCTAVVVIGTSVPTPVGCSFEFNATFTPIANTCAGETVAPGSLTVYPAPYAYTHTFSYTMRVAVDEVSAHGFGTATAGGAGVGFAEFSFAGTGCERRVPSRGLAEY